MADHLGWFDTQTKSGTIEEIMERAGRGDEIERGAVGVPLARLATTGATLKQEAGKEDLKIKIEDAFSFLPKEMMERENERRAKADGIVEHGEEGKV